ncbi:MAG: hypothetical protein ABIO43_11990 [Sphingomicrobium sp.]
MSDGPQWFEPTRYGYGSGMPIAWQGWALLIGYMALLLAASLILPSSMLAYLAVVFTLTGLLLIVCARTTKGGWRWRWGDKD